MGLKFCFIVMNVRPEAQPRRTLGEAIPALFERWLANFFAPRALHVWLDGGEAIDLTRLDPPRRVGTQSLWQGEVIEDGPPLTRCPPDDSLALIAEAAALLTARSPRTLYLRAEGALRHRAVDEVEPQWYGRWLIHSLPALSDLVEIRLEWTEARRNLEILFRLSGYPLTSVTLLPLGRLDPGDPEIAAANRALIMPALAYASVSFGLAPEEVKWTDDGDYAELYPQDAIDLRHQWLPRLCSGEFVRGGHGKPNGTIFVSLPDRDDLDVANLLATLKAAGPRRLWALEDLAHGPTGDPRVAAATEAVLDDKTPCRVEQHYLCEARLLAGLALLAERAAGGSENPVRLRCVPPVQTADLMTLLDRAGLLWPETTDADADAGVTAFTTARDRGLVKERDLELHRPVDVAALALALRPDIMSNDSTSDPELAVPPQQETAAAPRKATEVDVEFQLRELTQGGRDDRIFSLQDLARFPTANAKIREALRPLLADTTPCLLQIPYRFGELCLLAGAALAAERWASGDDRPVILRCRPPLTSDQLEEARMAAGLTSPEYVGDPIEQQLALFALLREHGALPEVDLELRHPVHFGWLQV